MGNDRRRSEFGIFNSRIEAIAWLRDELRFHTSASEKPRTGADTLAR
jgi:hypothetical protein